MGGSGLHNKAEMNYFDAHAATWDEKPHRVVRAREVGEAIVRNVRLTSDMDVLDYGCGTGMLAFFLARHVRSVTGADNSSGMLDMFRQKIEVGCLKRVQGIHLDLEHDAIPKDRFHLIVANMVFHHLADTEAMLQKFHQLLHPEKSVMPTRRTLRTSTPVVKEAERPLYATRCRTKDCNHKGC